MWGGGQTRSYGRSSADLGFEARGVGADEPKIRACRLKPRSSRQGRSGAQASRIPLRGLHLPVLFHRLPSSFINLIASSAAIKAWALSYTVTVTVWTRRDGSYDGASDSHRLVRCSARCGSFRCIESFPLSAHPRLSAILHSAAQSGLAIAATVTMAHSHSRLLPLFVYFTSIGNPTNEIRLIQWTGVDMQMACLPGLGNLNSLGNHCHAGEHYSLAYHTALYDSIDSRDQDQCPEDLLLLLQGYNGVEGERKSFISAHRIL